MPRCHPQCKSKVVLESICKSCHEIKECFRNQGDFDKYFEDVRFFHHYTAQHSTNTLTPMFHLILSSSFLVKQSEVLSGRFHLSERVIFQYTKL